MLALERQRWVEVSSEGECHAAEVARHPTTDCTCFVVRAGHRCASDRDRACDTTAQRPAAAAIDATAGLADWSIPQRSSQTQHRIVARGSLLKLRVN
jgi:hypothetical protein